MKTFSQALLLTPELWSSACWQERTSLVMPPWEAPLEFANGTPTMTKQVAQDIKALVQAMADPSTVLLSHGKATAQRQDKVYYMTRFANARASWQSWVGKFLPTWKFRADIDNWAASRGVDFDSLIIMSKSRKVSSSLVSHRLNEPESGE